MLIEIGFFLISFAIHMFSGIKLFVSKKQMFLIYATTLIIGSIWDNYAVFRGHWFYPGDGTLGIFIGLIPLEDYIFMILVPYSLIVLYKFSIKILGKK